MADKFLNSLGLTTVKNWVTSLISGLSDDIADKQDILVSGTNIKTINGTSILGSGNVATGSSIFLEYGVSSELDVAEAYDAFNGNTEVYVIYSDSTDEFVYRIARFEDVTTSYTLTTEVCDIIFSVIVTGDTDPDNPAEWDITRDDVIYRSDIENSISSASENPVESRAIKTYVDSELSTKQDVLVSGENIKIINGQSVLGSGQVNLDIPTKTSDLTNDSNFQTMAEVEALIADELSRFDKLDYEIVTALPSAGSAGVRYLIKHPSDDRYEEYIYVNNTWYDIGSTNELDIEPATDSVAGIVKTNSAQAVTLNADGQLEVGGRLGQFTGTTGIYAAADRDPRAVGGSSFLITDAMGMSLDTNRAFALVSGYGVTCKSADAGATQYRVKNTYANRLKCKMCEGGFASINEATSKVERIVPVVSVTINDNPYTPDSSADSSATANDIVITTAETLNPDSATTGIRLFGVMKSYSTVHVGNGVASLGGGRNLFVGGGITKVGNSNDDCAVGSDMYISGNGNAAFGRWHIMRKNRGFAAGTGHDFTNAMGEGAAAVGQYSNISSTTLLAVGNGTSHTARSNAFEVTSDGCIVLKSPNGTRYKISVDDSGNISTTAV